MLRGLPGDKEIPLAAAVPPVHEFGVQIGQHLLELELNLVLGVALVDPQEVAVLGEDHVVLFLLGVRVEAAPGVVQLGFLAEDGDPDKGDIGHAREHDPPFAPQSKIDLLQDDPVAVGDKGSTKIGPVVGISCMLKRYCRAHSGKVVVRNRQIVGGIRAAGAGVKGKGLVRGSSRLPKCALAGVVNILLGIARGLGRGCHGHGCERLLPEEFYLGPEGGCRYERNNYGHLIPLFTKRTEDSF